jgi:RNA:NAD 2'-phosphotransferase (TPT1/KptA family)
MNRMHIHFATKPHLLRSNSWATVLLRLDLQAALRAGHTFYMSPNDVLLCEGPLPVALLMKTDTGDLPQEWAMALLTER